MPTELQDLHPVVQAIQNDSGRLNMGGSLRQRSLLYLHGLTREALRRGYTVAEEPIADRHTVVSPRMAGRARRITPAVRAN
jgi:hypothetical protein